MSVRAFVRLPHLPTAVLGIDSGAVGVVVDDKADGSFVPRSVSRLIDASPAARAEGVRVGMRVLDAQRHCPQLLVRVVERRALQAELVLVAEVLLAVVPGAAPVLAATVDGACCGVACDTAQLPEPPERVLLRMEEACRRAGHACVVVSAPTVRLARAASHRLARGGGRTRLVITDPAPVLARLDLAALELSPAHEDALRALGVRDATQLRALLDAGGADRLGDAAADIVRLFHLVKEPIESVPPPVRIDERIELEEPLAALEPLAFLLRRLCERCVLRTLARRERVAEMVLTLLRKRGDPTQIVLAFPAPLVDAAPIARAFLARLERLELDAAFDGVTLEVTRRVSGGHEQLPLDPHERARARVDRALLHLMAEMQAELGVDRVGALAITDDVRPEKMTAVAWPPRRPPPRPQQKPRRRVRRRQADSAARTDAPTAHGRFLAGWPWPVRLLPSPERLAPSVSRDVRSQELLGLLEGDDPTDQPYQRRYAVLHLNDGRRALALLDHETEDRWLCGWFD